MVKLLPTLLALAAGCGASSELAQPLLRTRTGPAAAHPPHRVVALPASCGALSTIRIPNAADPDHPTFQVRELCPASAMQAIDIMLRGKLEFAGFQIIDSEKVNAVTGTRHEIEQRTAYMTTRTIEQHGARFEDATPFEQAAILHELGADGLLTTRIWIGAGIGFGERRTVAAQVRLVSISDGALVWARRCEIEVGGLLTTDEVAMENAARCAIEGAK